MSMTKSEAIARIIAIAEAEVGYREKASASDLDSKTGNAGQNNYTKFARDLDAVDYFNTKKQGLAWCAVFCCWLFWELADHGKAKALEMLYQPEAGNCGAACTYGFKYFRSGGALYSTPEIGDVAFFGSNDNSQHQGIVIDVTPSGFVTIEGNSSNNVSRLSYATAKTDLIGFGRPKYSVLDSDPATVPGKEYDFSRISALLRDLAEAFDSL